MGKLNKINLNGTEILLEQLSKYINILEPDENGNLDIKNIPNHTWTLIPVGGMLGGYDSNGNFVTNGCSFYNSNGGDATSERLNTVRIINMGRYSNYCYIKMIWFAPNASTWNQNGVASGIMYGTAGPSSYSDTSLPGLSFSGLLDNNSLKSNSLNISGLWTFSNSSAIPRLSNDTTPLTPTDARHIVNKAYVDERAPKEYHLDFRTIQGSYPYQYTVRREADLDNYILADITDETLIAQLEEIDALITAGSAPKVFLSFYTCERWGSGFNDGNVNIDVLATIWKYGARDYVIQAEDCVDKTSYSTPIPGRSIFGVYKNSSSETYKIRYATFLNQAPAAREYVNNRIAEEVSTPVITLDISQMISPTECALTQEQRAIVEDDSIGVLYIDGTSLGNPKGIFYKTRIYTTDNVGFVELTSVLYNGNIIVVATGVYNRSTCVATLEYKNILTIDNTSVYTPTQQYHPATKGYVDTAIAASGGGGGLPSLTLEDTIFELTGDTESVELETTDVEAIFAFADGLSVGDEGNKQIILSVTDQNNLARQFIAVLHRTITDTQTADTDAITINCYDNAAMLFTIYASVTTREGEEDEVFGAYDSLWLADSITINDMMEEINFQMSANAYEMVGIESFTPLNTYDEGDYVYNGDDRLIYKCNTDNTTGDFDPTYWDEVSYMDYMREQLIGNALGGSY